MFKVKKLIYYVLTCAITASHSPIVRAADTDSDLAPDELKTCHSPISRAADSEPDELNEEKTLVTEEGEHGDKLYIKQSHLREILFSPPGEHETKGFSDPFLNGFKCVKFKNEKGEEETYLLHGSFKQKYISRFPMNDQLVSFPLTMLTPGIPAWGANVELPPKKKSSKKKSSHRKHRSKRTKKVVS